MLRIFFLLSLVTIGNLPENQVYPGIYKGSKTVSENNFMNVILTLNMDGSYEYKKRFSSGGIHTTSGEYQFISDTLQLKPSFVQMKGNKNKVKHTCPTSMEEHQKNCDFIYLYTKKDKVFLAKRTGKYINPLTRLEKFE